MNKSEPQSTSDIVSKALDQWVELTGVAMDQRSFSLGDLSIHSMNEILQKAQTLDPEGTTAYLLIECFLREYLEQKTFTAAAIMKDYAATSAYLEKAEKLFSIVQSDRALEIAAGFRSKVLSGVAHYGADREDVCEMINDPDILPFLRRDALHSLEDLKPYQFLSGPHDPMPAQVIEHVYQAWNINDLLVAVRDMPVSGIAVVLLRDPANPERSYFTFAMRNGENVTLFTDRNKPAYPGQEDVLAGRGGRGATRAFMKRAHSNHFPYQLIKTHQDENGDTHFSKETGLSAAGVDLVALMKIKDLPPYQIIWITMMLSLISERFWHKKWQAKDMSYTGAMIQAKSLLISDTNGALLPGASNYQSISLEDVSPDEITAEAMSDQISGKAAGTNAWLEQRYRARVPHNVVNLWRAEPGTTFMLPKAPRENGPPVHITTTGTEVSAGVVAYKDTHKLSSWERPRGYLLKTFSEAEFGTEEDLRKDRLFISRYNFAQHIQKSADEEFAARKDEIIKWYQKTLSNNAPALLQMIAVKSRALKDGDKSDRSIVLGEIQGEEFRYGHYFGVNFGDINSKGKRLCYLTEAAATYRALLKPETAADLAILAGCPVKSLPDVLQHWTCSDPQIGNHLLNRMDPMDYEVENPWRKISFEVNFYLSKRGLSRIEKDIK